MRPMSLRLSLTSGQFSNPFASYTLNGKTGDPFPGAAVFPDARCLHQRPTQHEGHLHDAVEPELSAPAGQGLDGDGELSGQCLPAHLGLDGYQLFHLYRPDREHVEHQSTAASPICSILPLASSMAISSRPTTAPTPSTTASCSRRITAWPTTSRSLTTYTWSHCVSTWDFAGELAGTVYQNPLNRATGERGNCGYRPPAELQLVDSLPQPRYRLQFCQGDHQRLAGVPVRQPVHRRPDPTQCRQRCFAQHPESGPSVRSPAGPGVWLAQDPP